MVFCNVCAFCLNILFDLLRRFVGFLTDESIEMYFNGISIFGLSIESSIFAFDFSIDRRI
jgi:hypothetical protein